MRAITITGQLKDWGGLDELAKLLRQEQILMGDTKPAPSGIKAYIMSDSIVVMVNGLPNRGYTFTINIIADSETIDGLWDRLTRPGSEIYIINPVMIVAATFPAREHCTA